MQAKARDGERPRPDIPIDARLGRRGTIADTDATCWPGTGTTRRPRCTCVAARRREAALRSGRSPNQYRHARLM